MGPADGEEGSTLGEDRLPEALRPLAFLVGVWEGQGRGLWAAEPPLGYRERLTIACDGRPLLRYREETWHLDAPAPLHTELGFIRPVGMGVAELLVVQAAGILEVERGPISARGLDLASVAVDAEPCQLAVTAARRRLRRDGDRLSVLVQIGMNGEEPRDHVRAELRRVADPAPAGPPPKAARASTGSG
ncbi:MAG TPA: FABP family protein [Candidatus Micrarchaeia archaeon]|nr:FABP family protein [Candidatus Micrarchaeia archaeon]